MAYFLVLFLHSWVRWLIVISGLVALFGALTAKGRPRTFADRSIARMFVGAIDVQLLLGLGLYFFLSPLARAARANFKLAMHEPVLRFFVVEHQTLMLLAVIVAHVGSVWARRGATDALQHRRWAIALGATLLLILAGIPWPGLPYGRDLFLMPSLR